MTYAVAFFKYNQVHFAASFSELEAARESAIALDVSLGEGYHGIAFIVAEHSNQMAYVGNGALRIDDDEYGKSLEWVTAYPEVLEAMAMRSASGA